MDQLYKEEHEHFVSDSNGTSVLEVLMLSMLTLCSSIILSTLKLAYSHVYPFKVSSEKYAWFLELVESVLLCCPLVLATTVLNGQLETLFLVFLLGALGSGLVVRRLGSSRLAPESNSSLKGTSGYVSLFRSHLLINTSLSILAVDFPVYPRRLAKTDLFGFGYMDVGVGCFIVTAGIVSSEARGKPMTSKWHRVKYAFTSSLVMILLGLVRAVSIWATNYQVHVTEYGVHWNFFMTMAAVKVLCSSLLCLGSLNRVCLASGFSVLLYQWLLSQWGLTAFLLEERREGLFQENKEGLLSLVGYCFLYLLAVQVGRIIFSSKSDKRVALSLSTVAVISYLVMLASHEFVQPVSRRLFNTAYIFWMIFFNCFQVLLFLIGWKVIPPNSQSPLLQAIHKNPMLHFLFANLLTGGINFATDTIHANALKAVTVISVYLAVLSFAVLHLHRRNLKMDFSTFKFKKG